MSLFEEYLADYKEKAEFLPNPSRKKLMEEVWNKALEVAAIEVNKIALHHNTIVCAVDVINRNRTDT